MHKRVWWVLAVVAVIAGAWLYFDRGPSVAAQAQDWYDGNCFLKAQTASAAYEVMLQTRELSTWEGSLRLLDETIKSKPACFPKLAIVYGGQSFMTSDTQDAVANSSVIAPGVQWSWLTVRTVRDDEMPVLACIEGGQDATTCSMDFIGDPTTGGLPPLG